MLDPCCCMSLSLVVASKGFSCCRAWALGCMGFSSCGTWARSCSSQTLEHRHNSCGSQAELIHDMSDLPGPGIKPLSPALVGRFLTTEPPGKPLEGFLIPNSSSFVGWLAFILADLGWLWLDGLDDCDEWSDSALCHVSTQNMPSLHTFSWHGRVTRPQAWSLKEWKHTANFQVSACKHLITFCWPKQITWPSPESEWAGLQN